MIDYSRIVLCEVYLLGLEDVMKIKLWSQEMFFGEVEIFWDFERSEELYYY